MKTCLVSLVSDQTIPNILVALDRNADFLLFITTDAMEKKGKSDAILRTLRLRGMDYGPAHHKIEVLEDSILDLQRKVSEWLVQSTDEYNFIVNLTGGNKLMSIAAYDLFTDFGSEMVYVPIPKNEYLVPFPKRRPRDPVPLTGRLSVVEYLAAYGFGIENEAYLERNRKQALSRAELTHAIWDHYGDMEPVLQQLWISLRNVSRRALRKGYGFSVALPDMMVPQREILRRLGFHIRGSEIRKQITDTEARYLRGGWLEERVFVAVREALGDKADVQLGLVYADKDVRNELDVVFTLDNVLYLVECKSLDSPEGSGEPLGGAINDFLYKIGALRRNFGLTPQAFLATTSRKILGEDGEIKPHLQERARQLGTEIVPLLKLEHLEPYFARLASR